ncbi:MAG: hypothetical protein MJZ29_12595 [Bacteroidaceae bacterium]|nr:hypothetical protein [Bacteroidaceae bacterium]
MKKIFTLMTAMLLLCGLSANAQSRKTWDFTKGVSEETRAMLDADAAQWTKTMNSEGTATSTWATINAVEGELMAGGVVIPEFAGLNFSQFAAGNAVLIRGNCVRLQKNCSFTISGLTAGQTIVMKAQSANATATDRGFGFTNASIVDGPENGICLGRDAEGAPEGGVSTITLKVSEDGEVQFSTGVNGAPKSGVEILSIIIDGGDKNIKKWDFSAWSDATIEQVCAAEDWTTAESASKDYVTGNEIRWINAPAFDANNDLTAGGTAIKEMKGLRYEGLAQYGIALAFNYGTTLDANAWGPYAGPKYIWICNAADKIIVPNVKLGSVLKLGVETHKPGDARGFKLSVGGKEVAAQTTTELATLEYAIPADAADEDGDGYADVTIIATKGCHLYSIEAEVKDEAVVDKNPALGKPTLSIKDGQKISTSFESFTLTFPYAKNMEPTTEITLEGYFGPAETDSPDDYMFDGLVGTVGDGITFTISDYTTLEESTTYVFYITKMTVADPYGKFSEEGDQLYKTTLITKGGVITEPRAWQFHNDDEMAAELQASVDAAYGYWNASSKGRYSYGMPIIEQELMLTPDKKYPNTEGLYFTMNTANDILVGTPAGNNDKIQLGGGTPKVHIPSVAAGDEVTIKALWSTKNSGTINIENGTCEGEPTITLSGSAVEYKIVVEADGDLVLNSKNTIYQAISIYPASMGKEKINYTINAVNGETVLAKIAEGEGETNDKVSYNYSYWLADAEGNLYTKGTRGTPFTETISLVSGQNDYNVEYKKTDITGVQFCAEAEDIEGMVPVTQANSAIRSSRCGAAYNDADITLCTLEPGTYKIEAVIFDASTTLGHTVTFMVGEQQVDLSASLVNFSDETSELITVEAASPVVLKAQGSETVGLDAVVIYASTDAPEEEDPDAIANVNASAKTATKKIMSQQGLVIKTAKGTFNVVGAKIK